VLTNCSVLETHYKTWIVFRCFTLTFVGWWIWNAILAAAYSPGVSAYAVRKGFTLTFGSDPQWWLTLIVIIAILICMELAYKAVKRNLIIAGLWKWPPWKEAALGESAEEWDLELWQEMEKDPAVRERLRRMNEEGEEGDEEGVNEIDAMDFERRTS
jgi:phospholipid-translocating ATPase